MPQIGVWTTSSGTSDARLELETDQGGITTTELPSWSSNALKGAVAGATAGAAGGPVGAVIGAVTGGALGAASGAITPGMSPSAPSSSSPKQPTDASRAAIIQALQQFAAIIPALVQVVSASSPGGKESAIGDAGESVDSSEWGPEAFHGNWTVP